MRKPFCYDASRALYEDYYTMQNGEEVPVFYGARTQRGHGLGSILGELFRRALPFLSSGAKTLGQQAMNVASDMTDGKSFQDSAKSRLKEGIKIFCNVESDHSSVWEQSEKEAPSSAVEEAE